jgi:hypothetical protein
MDTPQVIQQFNIVGASIFLQFVLLFILFVATYLANAYITAVDTSNHLDYRSKHSKPLSQIFVLLGVFFSFGPLIISESFVSMWEPIFQGVDISLPNQKSLLLVFIVDLIIVTFLIWYSGGSGKSPFVSVLFMLPALAIFLRLDTSTFVSCAAYSIVAYIFLFYSHNNSNAPSGNIPHIFVNVSCLVLSIVTGYFTRPIPISQL